MFRSNEEVYEFPGSCHFEKVISDCLMVSTEKVASDVFSVYWHGHPADPPSRRVSEIEGSYCCRSNAFIFPKWREHKIVKGHDYTVVHGICTLGFLMLTMQFAQVPYYILDDEKTY